MPDEILLLILKQLNNMEVLYSLLDNNNGRLNILAQEEVFSNILKFVSIDDTNFIDRFCTDILPKIYRNVKCLIFDTVFMERILCTTNYPNLTELRILHFRQELASKYFTNDSPFQSIFQEQITHLTLFNNDRRRMIDSLENYTTNVYANILNLFKNLKHLTINGPSFTSYPGLSLSNLPSTTFSSSILTYLHINVNTLEECLRLLDGRLKQLTTLSIHICFVDNYLSTVHNTDNIPNLKCFSLKSFSLFARYDKIVSLLRRMPYLEKLTLFLPVTGRNKVIDGIDIQNDILRYMSQLHSFTFYICTHLDMIDLPLALSYRDIQQTFITIKEEHVDGIVNYVTPNVGYCSIFSLPFEFEHLPQLGTTFPNIIFSHVTILFVQDINPLKHEFFIRIARSFPVLKYLRILNCKSQRSYDFNTFSWNNNQQYSIIKYPHLTSLDVKHAHRDYIEQFLCETKAYVPSLIELKVDDFQLEVVTNLFRREDTRLNCAKIKRLITTTPIEHSENFFLYFPSLKM